MEMELGVTQEGKRLLRELISSEDGIKRAKSTLNKCESALLNARDALIKWIVPAGAVVGQTYCLAVGNVWLDVQLVDKEVVCIDPDGSSYPMKETDYKISWRPRPPKDGYL